MLEQSSSGTIDPYSHMEEEEDDGIGTSTSQQLGQPTRVSSATEEATSLGVSTIKEPGEIEKKKRFRKSYSCGNCRHRKIKCDRTFPCQQCKQRGIASQCSPTAHHGSKRRHRETGVEGKQKSYESEEEKKLKEQERQGSQERYDHPRQQQQQTTHQQQQKYPYERHQEKDRAARRQSGSFADGTTPVASPDPSNAERRFTSSRGALDSLYRTMESFQTQISQMELRVQSAQVLQATSSSSAAAAAAATAAGGGTNNEPHRRHRHSTTSASIHHHQHRVTSRHRPSHHHHQPNDKYEMVLAHMKTLELKLDLILKRLMYMNNQAAALAGAPTMIPPLLSLGPFGQGERAPNNNNMMSSLVQQQQQQQQQQHPQDISESEFLLDQAIDRWLEQEGLPSSGFLLDEQQQSQAGSQTRGGHESMAHPPFSAPTAPLSHMNDYFTGNR